MAIEAQVVMGRAGKASATGVGLLALAMSIYKLQCTMMEVSGDEVRSLPAQKLKVPLNEEMAPTALALPLDMRQSSRSNVARKPTYQCRLFGDPYVPPEWTFSANKNDTAGLAGAVSTALCSLRRKDARAPQQPNFEVSATPLHSKSSCTHVVFTLTLKQQL
ncbi:hypothetical protein NXY56_002585 [Leishmania guyanensis]